MGTRGTAFALVTLSFWNSFPRDLGDSLGFQSFIFSEAFKDQTFKGGFNLALKFDLLYDGYKIFLMNLYYFDIVFYVPFVSHCGHSFDFRQAGYKSKEMQ